MHKFMSHNILCSCSASCQIGLDTQFEREVDACPSTRFNTLSGLTKVAFDLEQKYTCQAVSQANVCSPLKIQIESQ